MLKLNPFFCTKACMVSFTCRLSNSAAWQSSSRGQKAINGSTLERLFHLCLVLFSHLFAPSLVFSCLADVGQHKHCTVVCSPPKKPFWASTPSLNRGSHLQSSFGQSSWRRLGILTTCSHGAPIMKSCLASSKSCSNLDVRLDISESFSPNNSSCPGRSGGCKNRTFENSLQFAWPHTSKFWQDGVFLLQYCIEVAFAQCEAL